MLSDLDGNQNVETDFSLDRKKKDQLLFENQKEEQEQEQETTNENYKDVFEKTNGEDDEPRIFGFEQTSIGRSAKDQFADALLRLQSDLDNTTGRLDELATKVDGIQSSGRRSQQQQQQTKSSANRTTAETLFYIGWPVLVFFAIRGLERRYEMRK